MGLKGIIAVSGMPGLYKVLAQNKSGFIVESLADKKRMPVAATQRISMLEDITVYMQSEDITLKDVFMNMVEFSKTNKLVDPKADAAELRKCFGKVVPGFDSDRVYTSDIKKMFIWFELVKDFVAVPDEGEQTPSENAVAEPPTASSEEVAAEKPKKAPRKKAAKKPASDAAE